MLRRLGNKAKVASEIIKYFPSHSVYIEPFFGAGGMFFNKPKARYNFLNDLDSDVYNLWNQLLTNKERLKELVYMTPICTDIFNDFRLNKYEDNPEMKALRFLYLSNYTYLGKMDCLKFGIENSKKITYNNIDDSFEYLQDCQIMNCDFRAIFDKISYRHISDKENTFIYCDPPYLSTDDNYSNSFTKKDTTGLFDLLIDTGMKFAVSEFQNEFIINLAKERGLFVHEIGERQSLKNRSTEILITNYIDRQLKLF